MDATALIAALALMTIVATCVFALWSKAATERKRADPHAPKSTLAADAPSRGKPDL
ncbi:MAG: hypothetical protein JNK88_11340 [Mangrovicoccus sp.]|nr:hypothetical protein [Mangrovicoccus sp.]